MNDKMFFRSFILLSALIVVLLSIAVLNISGPVGQFSGIYVCNDTDNGINYAERGTVWGTEGTFTDYCIDENTLFEYYCVEIKEQAYSQGHKYVCENACNSGSC